MAYALVTGASSGIGRELALLLARDGHDLILAARSRSRLDAVRAVIERECGERDGRGVHVDVIAIDLSEPDAAARLHEWTRSRGRDVDTLVNNAGFADWTDYLDADWDRQQRMMRLNMETLAHLCHLYGHDMRDAGRGRILNIASVASMMAGPYMATYFATKAFVRSLSEALAHELRGTGVSVTCVCPGPTTTGFAEAARMSGRNFFTMTRPATARDLARYAFRRMNAGAVLAYHGPLTRAGALAERLLPRAFTRRIAARMNGGRPRR
ncbi:SDR family NAD(P)-dependent oxidoreductase [Bifidobacterium samirii]|uniref:Short-chain dehydrogenase n=1 Tax=Bifidobacterium samirii TaxID=2306974 RepID=A0A430FWL0_9BIFI|nr:SDR family oxidoreductase [Bifidobacterium samirii]RSX58760.1 short-chain dehydrogenase [Bifidobacterium samirii]